MSTELSTSAPKNSIKALLTGDAFKEQVRLALPEHLKPERFVRIALTALNRTPKLQQCTQQSLFQCLLDLSSMGLEPDGRRAHLIPYKDQCTLVVDYKGLVELVLRSGEVSTIHADVVCENDEFEYSMGRITKHIPNLRKPRGEVYAAYAHVVMKDGGVKDEVMSKDEIESIRKRSRSGTNGPWVTDWNEMAKKTVFRRCSKWLPLSADLREKIEKDDEDFPSRPEVKVESAVFVGEPEEEVQEAPVAETEVVDSPQDELSNLLAEKGVSAADFVTWAVEEKHAPASVGELADLSDAKAKAFIKGIDAIVAAIKK
jgi:recombination protein RecT